MKIRLADGSIPKIVFLDLDGTLISVSSEKTLVEYLYKRKRVTHKRALMFLIAYITHPVLDIKFGKGWNRTYLKGLPYDLLRENIENCVKENIIRYLRSEIVSSIAEVKEKGSRIVLLTAALDEPGKPIAEQLGYDEIVASTLEVKDNVLTGNISNVRPWGKAKPEHARRYAEKSGTSLTECAALGDSLSDRYLLEVCGTPITVCPDRKLRRLAEDNRWQIIEGEHTKWG